MVAFPNENSWPTGTWNKGGLVPGMLFRLQEGSTWTWHPFSFTPDVFAWGWGRTFLPLANWVLLAAISCFINHIIALHIGHLLRPRYVQPFREVKRWIRALESNAKLQYNFNTTPMYGDSAFHQCHRGTVLFIFQKKALRLTPTFRDYPFALAVSLHVTLTHSRKDSFWRLESIPRDAEAPSNFQP